MGARQTLKLPFFAVLALAILSTQALAAETRLFAEKDRRVVDLLADLDLAGSSALASGLRFKVYVANYGNECDPRNEAKTCPRSELLVVITSPIQPAAVWRSTKRIGWKVESPIEEVSPGRSVGDFGGAAFEASVCEASPSVESGKVDPRIGGWWIERRYRVVAGLNGVSLIPMPQSDSPIECPLY
jgi:hypothetical protein